MVKLAIGTRGPDKAVRWRWSKSLDRPVSVMVAIARLAAHREVADLVHLVLDDGGMIEACQDDLIDAVARLMDSGNADGLGGGHRPPEKGDLVLLRETSVRTVATVARAWRDERSKYFELDVQREPPSPFRLAPDPGERVCVSRSIDSGGYPGGTRGGDSTTSSGPPSLSVLTRVGET